MIYSRRSAAAEVSSLNAHPLASSRRRESTTSMISPTSLDVVDVEAGGSYYGGKSQSRNRTGRRSLSRFVLFELGGGNKKWIVVVALQAAIILVLLLRVRKDEAAVARSTYRYKIDVW